MTTLIKFIRYYILTFSVSLAAILGLFIYLTIPIESLRIIQLTRLFAFTSVIYLYLALLVSPFYSAFPTAPWRGLAVKSRRSLGVSAFFFALLHASFAFFGQLGGFPGLGFLTNKYLIAISLGFCALLILGVMASLSFDTMVNRLGRRWKMIHRLVYLAGIYIVIHGLMLGSHFIDLNQLIPQIFLIMLSLLLILEALRFDKYLASRGLTPSFGISLLVVVGVVTASFFYLLQPKTGTTSLGLHTQHQKLALDSQNQNQTSSANPALNGDRTRRFSVELDTEGELTSNSDIKLTFSVRDAATGSPVTFFALNQEKLAHLIVVDEKLEFIDHLHPEQSGNQFTQTVRLPADSNYRLYLDFQPTGAIEQQFASALQIGNPKPVEGAPADDQKTKKFGDYEVTISSAGVLNASRLTLGTQEVNFTIKKNGQDVTSLKPYLGAFGHMVFIKADSYEYYHVHPTNLKPPAPEETSGPQVSFLPIGIYGPIKPGMYRVFAQFNPEGNLLTTNFTVRVE